MSNYEQRDGSGILFRNERREKESQPNYTGSITIAGIPYRLSAWVKEGRNGKFLSLAAQPKSDAAPKRAPSADMFDDDGMPL